MTTDLALKLLNLIANRLMLLHNAGVVLGGAITQDAVKVQLSADGRTSVLFGKFDTAYLIARQDVV